MGFRVDQTRELACIFIGGNGMNTTYRGIITLLKSAITGEQLTLPEGFSMEDADALITAQSLAPLAYQGAFRCGISKESELMRGYKEKYLSALFLNERQMQAVKQILRAFEDNGIEYMTLKGCNMKQLFPQPEMRMMGDADILIRVEQYDKIRPIMEGLGYSEGEDYSHVRDWYGKDLYLELHKCLFPEDEKDFYPYFGDGWNMAVKQEGCRYALRPEDEYVFLFTHMTKHYRGGGIGSRQFLDLYVFRRAHPQMDEEYIENKMDRIHLLEFYRNTRNLLDVWFADRAPDAKTDHMTQYIMENGNWGDADTQFYSEQLKQSAGAEELHNTKLTALWRAVFLPMQIMRRRYPPLVKYPWLYPVFCVVRWVRLIFNPNLVHKRMSTVNRMTDEKVNARKQALNFVGLDFYNE